MPSVLKTLLAPLAILAGAALALAFKRSLGPQLSGIVFYAPYVVYALGIGISLWFHRGRTFLLSAMLFVAYVGYEAGMAVGPGSFAARAVLVSIALFLPLNFLLVISLPERSVVHHRSYRWLLLVALEILLTQWVASAGRSAFSGTAWEGLLEHWLLSGMPPPLATILMAAALIVTIAKSLPRTAPLEVATAGAIGAFFVACIGANDPAQFQIFMAAAGVMLLMAVLQESHRMAFRDELTGLPSRRALEERLRTLGTVYTVAMVDVDRFKKFNDTHGHDVGDQVLRLVASRLMEVGGGGKAYRYGGEEFAVVFPERVLKQVLPELEALRAGIESYHLALRGKNRPKDAETGRGRRGSTASASGVSVTVSIGAAERNKWFPTPEDVILGADEALYRAKKRGRNRVVSR